jgi:hypothetical protein
MKTNWFCIFHNFYNILYFDEFCRLCCFEYLKSTFIKNLKMDSSFFRIFYFKFMKNSNLTDRFFENWFLWFLRKSASCHAVFQSMSRSVDLSIYPFFLPLLDSSRSSSIIASTCFVPWSHSRWRCVMREMRATAELARTTWIHVSFGENDAILTWETLLWSKLGLQEE